MLLATKVWALAHLLANGSLADVVLFGSFLAWAVAESVLAPLINASDEIHRVHPFVFSDVL